MNRLAKGLSTQRVIKFKEKFSDKVRLRIRYSLENLKLDGDLLNIPLFMVDFTDELIDIALKNKSDK